MEEHVREGRESLYCTQQHDGSGHKSHINTITLCGEKKERKRRG